MQICWYEQTENHCWPWRLESEKNCNECWIFHSSVFSKLLLINTFDSLKVFHWLFVEDFLRWKRTNRFAHVQYVKKQKQYSVNSLWTVGRSVTWKAGMTLCCVAAVFVSLSVLTKREKSVTEWNFIEYVCWTNGNVQMIYVCLPQHCLFFACFFFYLASSPSRGRHSSPDPRDHRRLFLSLEDPLCNVCFILKSAIEAIHFFILFFWRLVFAFENIL